MLKLKTPDTPAHCCVCRGDEDVLHLVMGRQEALAFAVPLCYYCMLRLSDVVDHHITAKAHWKQHGAPAALRAAAKPAATQPIVQRQPRPRIVPVVAVARKRSKTLQKILE